LIQTSTEQERKIPAKIELTELIESLSPEPESFFMKNRDFFGLFSLGGFLHRILLEHRLFELL